jgi:hypothetical protein
VRRSEGENETEKAEGEQENAGSREAAGRKREAGGKLYWRKVGRLALLSSLPIFYCSKI